MSKKEVLGSTSDAPPLVTVEDLINRALGPENTNQVDFKLLQAILQIFARQQRLLQQRVQLRLSDRTVPKRKKQKRPKSGQARRTGVELDDDDDLWQGSSGLEISETVRDKEKVLVVERASVSPRSPLRSPRGSPGSGRRGRGPIDVATRRQLAGVEESLQHLQEVAASSQHLGEHQRDDNLGARVAAAEEAVGGLLGVLGRLADAAALPPELRAAVSDVQAEWSRHVGPQPRRGRRSSSTNTPPAHVTRGDLDDILSDAMSELTRAVGDATARAGESAEWALRKAQAVGEKMERASSLNQRLSNLQALVEDYYEQIGGFETGLTTQIRQFQEQIEQIDGDLSAGLRQLQQVNTNTETAAVIALTERYEDLVLQLEATVHDNKSVAAGQSRLAREIYNLSQALENLKEQKCDRAEVVDGLRDKATTSQLQGLLRVERFESARDELDVRLAAFHDQFHDQETSWMEALKDLSERSDAKAQYSELVHARDLVQAQLEQLDGRLQQLAAAVGEPQVAVLTRALLADMKCASCRTPALQSKAARARPRARSHPRAHPRRRPSASDDESAWARPHACRRWCGGSHTLLSGVARAHAPPAVARHSAQAECAPCVACLPRDGCGGDGDRQD